MECVCLVVIALATGVGHWVIAARMRALRAAMILPIDQIAADDPLSDLIEALRSAAPDRLDEIVLIAAGAGFGSDT